MYLCRSRAVVPLALLVASSVAPVAGAREALTIVSSAFSDDGTLTAKNANNTSDCGGQNVSPPIAWSGAPTDTRSFAVVMLDPDGGKGLGSVHWVVYGIDPSTTSLDEGDGNTPDKQKLIGGTNTAGTTVYRGPCPPVGDSPHHYVIGVYALDLDPNALPPGLTRDALLEKVRGHSLAEASIVGRYGR